MKRQIQSNIRHFSCQKPDEILSMEQQATDIFHMQACLKQLESHTNKEADIPIAARIVHQELGVIADACNGAIHNLDPTAHAEICAIRNACRRVNNYRLSQCTLYVTLEPCMMCFTACIHARIDRIVFAAYDRKVGVLSKARYQQTHQYSNHHFQWTGGVCEAEASGLLVGFFKAHCRKEPSR